MLGIKVIAKLDGVTYQIKPEDRFGSKKKTRPKSIT